MNKEELKIGLKDIRKILLKQKKQMNKEEDKKDWIKYFKTIFEYDEYCTCAIGFAGLSRREYYYALIFFLLTGLNIIISNKLDKKYNSLVGDPNMQVNKEKIDYALEFIGSLTQDELNNYLSYKMGDSNE